MFYPYKFLDNYENEIMGKIVISNNDWVGIRKIDGHKISADKYFIKNYIGLKVIVPSGEELNRLSSTKLRNDDKDIKVLIKDLNNDENEEIFLDYEIYNVGASGWAVIRRYTIFTIKGNLVGYGDKILFDFFDKYYESDRGIQDKSSVFITNTDDDDFQEILIDLQYDEWGKRPVPPYHMINGEINILKWNGDIYIYQAPTLKAKITYFKELLGEDVYVQIFFGVILGIITLLIASLIIIFFYRKKKKKNII